MESRWIQFAAKFPLEYFSSCIRDAGNSEMGMELPEGGENIPVIRVNDRSGRERVVGIAKKVTFRSENEEKWVELDGLLFAEGGLEISVEPMRHEGRELSCVIWKDFVTCGMCEYCGGELEPGVYSCRNYKLPFCRAEDYCSYGKPREEKEV